MGLFGDKTPKTCSVCNRSFSGWGNPLPDGVLCDNCWHLVEDHFEHDDILEEEYSVEGAKQYIANRKKRKAAKPQPKIYKPKPLRLTDSCQNCGTAVGDEAAVLRDRSPICDDCASKVRIILPAIRTLIEEPGEEHQDAVLDPLNKITYPEFQKALVEADQARSRYHQHYGNCKAVFMVDETRRIEKGRQHTVNYIITGRTLYGKVQKGDRFTVRRRERAYQDIITRIEVPYCYKLSGRLADAIYEGYSGDFIFDHDIPYIYPGDILIIN